MLQIGDWQVDPALDELRRGSDVIKLEPRMTRLLCCLAGRPGEVFSSDELLEKVWPGVVVNPSSVYQVVALLRKHLGDEGDEPRYIATVPRKGYRLIAPVAKLEKPALAAELAAGTPVPVVAPTAIRRTALARWGIAATILLVAGLALFQVFRKPASAATAPALVVLPLVDLSLDGSNAAFCSGLTDELLNALGRVPGIRVTGRASALRARDDRIDTRELGKVLGVTHVLEGSVRATEGRLRVSAQLVSTGDGFQVWSNSYDRPRAEAIGIQTDIARAVVDALALQLDPAQRDRLERAPTKVVNAYELYLLGRYQQSLRNAESLARAVEYQKQAIAADPNFALAYAGLSDAYMAGIRYLNRDYAETIALAQPLVDQALRLDPELAEAYVSWGAIKLEQWENLDARKAFQRALAINPSYGVAMHGLGVSYEWDAEPRNALPVYEKATALDPLNPRIHNSRCNALYSLGHYAEAEIACKRAIELQPEASPSLVTYSEIAQFQGDLPHAIERMQQALDRAPRDYNLRTRLGVLYLDAGINDRALQEFAKAREDGADPVSLAKQLYGLAVSGDRAALQRAFESTPWEKAPVQARVEAAYVAHLAGDLPRARQLYESVHQELATTREPLRTGYYPLRLGTCELCSLTVLERLAGDAASADLHERAMLEQLEHLQANGYRLHSHQYFRAVLSAARGDDDSALASLEQAVEWGWRRAWLMRLDPAFAAIRDDARFQRLLVRIESANPRLAAR